MEIKEETITRRYVEFDGTRFYPDKKGYWIGHPKGRSMPIRLHQYVWEYYNGAIPDGYQVHHKDFNRDNNEIDNLQLMTKHDHLCYHAQFQDVERARMNLAINVRPKASEWHGSNEGLKWHSEHGKQVAEEQRNLFVTKVCAVCGKEYQVMQFKSESSRFCSNNCRAQWRRDVGIDNIEVHCEICGAPFYTNKYAKKRFCSDECRAIANRKRWDKILEKRRNAKNVVSNG